jgi:N-acetylglucosaminyl-diphospho-decaprenol L-rhamnosyltransferase
MGYLFVTNFEGQSITVSIVSHGQGHFVKSLLEDLADCPQVSVIILTQNIPEGDIQCPGSLLSKVRFINNKFPRGFSSNHNKAFSLCRTPFFLVLNPDIRFTGNPFTKLLNFYQLSEIGVIAPLVRNASGRVEDSVRKFPTLIRLFRKVIGIDDGSIAVAGKGVQEVDWVAGMFLLLPTNVFNDVGGFDEGFFLYYEDVDLCARLWQNGRRVVVDSDVGVIHFAQRQSRRNLRYMRWHIFSMFRYMVKHSWRLPR